MSPEAMGDFVIKLAQHYGIDRMHAVGPDVGTLALLFAALANPLVSAGPGIALDIGRRASPVTPSGRRVTIATTLPPGAAIRSLH